MIDGLDRGGRPRISSGLALVVVIVWAAPVAIGGAYWRRPHTESSRARVFDLGVIFLRLPLSLSLPLWVWA